MAEIHQGIEKDLLPKPKFDGGAFTISAFSSSPEGFELVTRKTIRRTEGVASNHLDPERTALLITKDNDIVQAKMTGAPEGDVSALEKERRAIRLALGPNATRLRDSMREELKFQNAQEVRDARSAWHSARDGGADEKVVESLRNAFYAQRAIYQEKGKKIKIRNIQVNGNVLSADVGMVSFPVHKELSRTENGAETTDLSAIASHSMIVKSADGRLILQHRAVAKRRLGESKLTRGNALFNDVPGASAAGMLDATLRTEGRKPGTPDPIDTDTILASSYKESEEELGLEPEHFDKVRIVGLAHNKIQIHDELLLLAETSLTAEQIREISRTSKRNKNLGDADFEEKFIDIDGSAKSITTLLTDVKCPLPPPHAASFVAAGYSVILNDLGKEEADIWKDKVEKGVRANYAIIDKTVKAFYGKHPEALMKVPERFWGKNPPPRNRDGYDPAYTPEEQGLPSFEDEMVRTGLVPETRTLVSEADLFDVDGVITDPKEKKVIHPEILDRIADRLKSGIPVALNTGRSIEWLREPVLAPLLERFKDDATGLENLALIAEFGGTWATFDSEGIMQEGKVDSLSVPNDLHEQVKVLVEKRFSGSMFDDASKETMISVEMNEGYDLDTFHTQQEQLAGELNAMLAETGNTDTYEVHRDTIATNIRSPYVGKDLGADRFLQFLRDKGIKPKKFRAFGDDPGDLAMSDELYRHGQTVESVYVGDPVKLNDVPRIYYPINIVPGFSTGTRDYLERN